LRCSRRRGINVNEGVQLILTKQVRIMLAPIEEK
jgi:hypothetical protein